MSDKNELSLLQIQANLTTLSSLSEGEFGCDLNAILKSHDEQLAMKRIGRLMAVSIKHPFAKPFPYDPTLPWNWAKSNRAWEILGPIPIHLQETHVHHYQFLTHVTEVWGRPEYKIAEWHVFHVICDKIRPIICDESKVLEETNKIAENIRKSGSPVAAMSTNDIIGVSSVTIATWLSQQLNIPSDFLPIITGTTLLLCCFGKNRLCKFLTDFKESHENNPNPFHDYPKCGSNRTHNGQPCENEVLNEGDLCWKHKK